MRKVIIIDDEKDARLLIRQYLEPYSEFEIIAECVNGVEAIEKINELEPDLIFLDIQMPGFSGFQVVQQIVHIPQIIFTTAFDQYALKAFENNALDYLLKPYTSERFAKAINKILSYNPANFNTVRKVADEATVATYPIRILVETGSKLINLDILDIYCLEAERDYTKIHTETKSYLSNYGISTLEQRMNPQIFLRVHRSYIINIHHILEVHREASSAVLILKNNMKVNVSRSYMNTFKRIIY